MRKVCREAFVRKEPCINGKRNLKITNYFSANGKCRPFRLTTNVFCDSNKKQFCKCNVVDNLHYRTYDGQSIHFSGGCRYTLTRYNKRFDSCSFNIEIENEYRDGNKHLSHTKSVIIHMFGEKFELGQHRTLKVGNIQRSIPYEKGEDVRIFYSHNVVQFVAPKCSVHVAFDKRSNAFIEVSKKYFKKMNGLCGDCNGIQDDLKTKSGKDVSKKKDKYSRIANSYKVTDLGKYCKSAEHISYKNFCRYSFIEKAKAKNLCSAIISRNNPFRKCGKQAHVDLKNFYEDCLIDMCANKNSKRHPKRVQCKILSVLSEVCAESGIPGIKWRSHYKCSKKCGENEHFTHKASPCPRTCENHFFGTRRPCYDLPEREGCECNKGFIRDGALCVKPMHCSCINLCIDRKGSRMCWKWKARGDCEKFPEPMNIMCRKTCNFCKQRDVLCKNEISTKQCLLFRRQGLCFDDFYSSLCGLTCNYDKCKCGDDHDIVEKCNANYIITTTHYSFARDSNGRCVKTIKQTYRPCCPNSWTNYGNCNLCTGKRNITMHSYDFVKMRCVLRSNTRYENCQKCPVNVREKRDCIGDKYLKTTVYFNRLIGCFQCVPDQRISTTEIKCKTTTVVKRIDRTTECTTIYKRTPLNCQCHTHITRKCCRYRKCPRSKTIKYCENGRFIYRTLSYELKCNCIPHYSYRTEIPKCRPKRPIFGRCEKTKNKLFYCKVIETQYTANVNANCKCIRNTLRHKRTCCCKEPHKYKKCNRNTGVLTTVYVFYQSVRRGKYLKCIKKSYATSVLINYSPHIIKRKGICKSNDMRTIQIFRNTRVGCKIKTTSDIYEQRCRCPKQIITKKKCEFNRKIVRRFIKKLVNFHCVDKLISKQEIPIICPNDQISKTECSHRIETVTTTSYSKLNCKCIKKVNIQIKKCICRERIVSEKTLKCDLKTCKQIHITVSINKNCNSEQLVCRYACCCKPSIITTSRCSPITGQITTTTETFYVVQKKSKCNSRTVSKVTKPKCNNIKVIKQKCGQERNNYQKITTIREILSKETCSCKTITTSIWKCCKLPETIVTESCKGNYFLVKIVKFKFDDKKINCISSSSQHIKRIQCPQIKDRIKITYLSKCQYEETQFYYEIRKCNCKLRKHSEIYLSCCPDNQEFVKCVDNTKSITTFISFHLSSNRKQCIKHDRKSIQNIICQKSKESRIMKISKCRYNIITDYYGVKNCKCEKYDMKIEKKRSCCNKPKINFSCLDNKIWREKTTEYKLKNDEECIEQVSHVDIIKKCTTPYAIVCPCPRNPKLKSIIWHFYVTINCQCVHRIKLIPCPCHKIPNKIEIGPCTTKHTRTVKVFKSVNFNDDCNWELLKSYEVVCKCKNVSIIKSCIKHSIYRTTTVNYNLVTVPSEYPTHTCVKSEVVQDKIIECNKNYIQYGNCINYKQSVTECVYKSVNCKCEMSCHITYRPCECWKLNHCKPRCIRNIKYSFCHKYKSGPSNCVLDFTSKIPIVEKCPSQTNIQCRELNYLINNCYYKSCEKSFYVYENCKCVKRTVTTDTIIRARKPIRRILCINNRRIMKLTNFIIKPNQCQPVHQDKIINIECPRWKVIETKEHGYTHYKITYYKIENCECIQKICRGPYFKQKCPFSKHYKECSRNNKLVYTHIVRQIHFTNKRLCPESGSPINEQICVETRNVRIEPKNCPNSYERISCIVSRNIKRIEKHYYKVVNCQCVKAVSVVETHPCKDCNKTITHESKCLSLDTDGVGHVEVTTKYWKITKKNTCEPHIKKSKRICCIGKIQKISECVNGKKLFKTIVIEKATECKPRISIISESIPCYNNGRPNEWIIERIHYCRRPDEFTIKYLVRKRFNPTNCGCINERKSVKIDICCRPCHYRTVCRHNNKIVTISYCQRREKLNCVNYKIEKNMQLECPSPVKSVIGDCKGSVIKYRIVSYVTIQCKCVKTVKEYIQIKISDVTKCINEMWRTTHVGYELYRHRCVPKQPQDIFTPIICSTDETFKDKRINHCDFSRSYFKKVVSNCRCVDRFVRQEILHYRCCQKPVISETCVNHNTRVVFKTNFNLLNFRCYPVRRESRFTVDCSHLKLQERINTGQCTYKIEYYYATTKNCKCYRALKYTRFNLCSCLDHLRPYKEQKCDKERGRLINTSYTYKLVGEKCHKITSITYSPINCDARICEKRYGKCIRNTQTIELFCLKRQGCECVKQIFKRHNVCCGPLKDSTWTNVGPCEERRGYYQLITTYALQYNYRTKECAPVVIKQQDKVCCCRKSFVRKSCFKNIYIKTTKYSYSINFPKNSHDERIDESIKEIPRCSKALNFTINERETIPDGMCIRTNKIITPVNCKCLERIEENRFLCPCYKPVSVKINKYCRNNNIIIETHYPKCRLNNIYWKIVKTINPILNCNKKEILYSPTFYYTWYKRSVDKKCCLESRLETHRQWYVHNCECRSKDIEKRLVCRKSLPPRQKEQCLGSKINIITYSYPIVNGICRKIVDKKIKHIPCPSQPKIHQSECINNKYTITTIYYFYYNCRCESRVEKRICDCQCNKDTKIIKCSRNYLLNEITTKYYRKDCRCLEAVNIRQIEPSCPQFIPQIIGNCEIQKRHSIYRLITNRQIEKDYENCKCLITNKYINKICGCEKQSKNRIICLNNNNFIIQTWEWRVNIRKNKCNKVLLNSNSKIISCPPMKIERICNYNTGKGKEITTTYKLDNCKCIKNERNRPINCTCDENPVLIKRGDCLSNKIRIDIYSHKEPRGQHCVTIKDNKYIICRCENNTNSKFCVNDVFVTFIISYKLIDNKCQENRIKTTENIKCSTDIEKIESICHQNGYKTIEFYKLSIYNCKCIRMKIKSEYCSCKCPANRFIQKCSKSGKLLIDIYYNYKIVNCKCQLIRTNKVKLISCPENKKTVSECNEKLYEYFWFKTTTIIEYNIHHCQCITFVKISKSLCKSNDSLIINTRCDREEKTEIRKVLRVKYENDKFVSTTTIEKIPITCNDNWFLVKRSDCYFDGLYGTEYLVYQRLVFENCKCISEIKNKKSDCRCTGPSESEKCEGNIIRKYHYKYKLVNLKCEKRVSKEETRKVYCESKTLRTGPCYQKDNKCIRDVERQDSSLSNCECSGRKETIQEICQSCCDGPPLTEKYCKESLNKFITKVSTCHVSTNGFIKNSLEIKEQDVPCNVGTNCVSVDGCNRRTSTETLKCTTTYLQNCVCLSKTETKNSICDCGPSKLEYGVCDKTSLTRPVYEIENRLVTLISGEKSCEKEKKKIKDEICDCPQLNVIKECINNRYIEKIKQYTFNNEMKTCDLKTSETDKTETCGPAFDRSTEACDPKTNKQTIKIKTKQLINCKCITTEKIETELCACEDRTETKCIENRFLETTVYKYTMDTEKKNCIPSVKQSRKEIECSVLDIDPEKFYRNNYDNCKKIVYEAKNCQCVQIITPQKCACSLKCSDETVSTTCVDGISRTNTTKYNLDNINCKCVTNIKIDDKQIKCAETPRNEISKTTTTYDNGDYYTVTSYFEKLENCVCKEKSSKKYVLTRCADKYNKSSSENGLYDYKCTKIPDPPSPPIVCPQNSTVSLGNSRSETTFYIIENDKCVKKTIVETCGVCKIQYCTEESSSCDSTKCSEDDIRAICPIKCGICEPCSGNESNCETNSFDNKKYRRKISD